MASKIIYQLDDKAVVVKQPDGILNLSDGESRTILTGFGLPAAVLEPIPNLKFNLNSRKKVQIEDGIIQEVYYSEINHREIKSFFYRLTLTPSAAVKGIRGEINLHTSEGFEFFVVTGGLAYLTVSKTASEGGAEHNRKYVTEKKNCEVWKLYPGCAVYLKHGVAQGWTGIGELAVNMSIFSAELLFLMHPAEFKDHGSTSVVMI